MKTKYLFVIALLFTLIGSVKADIKRPPDLTIPHSNLGFTTYIWIWPSNTQAGWSDVSDDFGVGAYQCNYPQRNECPLWSWREDIYNSVVLTDPSNPVQSKNEIYAWTINNRPDLLNPSYGITKTIQEAANNGVSLTWPTEAIEMMTFYDYNGIQYSWLW